MMKLVKKIKALPIECLLVYMCAMLPASASLDWLYIFIFTNFRTNHASVMIPVAIIIGILAVGMLMLKSWAVIVSIFITSIVVIFCTILVFIGHFIAVTIILLGVMYIYYAIRLLRS